MARWDLHTHYYPEAFFRLIEQVGGDFSFATSPTGQAIIRFRGARFFGITPPMTDPAKRLADMDRVGIDVEVLPTAEAVDRARWMHTGDLARQDADGFFYFSGRLKRLIKTSGFNVYPNEVEAVVAMHPGVLEVAAVGVADEKSGEAVEIFVVKRDPGLSAEAIVAYCRENLTGYKVPRQVEFRDELPKTNVGKILRRALR